MNEHASPNPQPGVAAFLETCGAGRIAHPGGTLLAHLQRTATLLSEWGAPEHVVLAGWCHAAYGTDGFDHPLVSHTDRARVVGVIGPPAEALVYRYASCDRHFTYPQLGGEQVQFRDRFTGQIDILIPSELQDFLELTFANELDVARHSPSFATGVWPRLTQVFGRCQNLVTPAAWLAYRQFAPSRAEIREGS